MPTCMCFYQAEVLVLEDLFVSRDCSPANHRIVKGLNEEGGSFDIGKVLPHSCLRVVLICVLETVAWSSKSVIKFLHGLAIQNMIDLQVMSFLNSIETVLMKHQLLLYIRSQISRESSKELAF